MIAYAIEQGYLKRLDLEEARIKLSGHPAGKEPGALLRLLRSRYLAPDHLEELRRYYQRTKAELVRAAEEAKLEVLSISDILVAAPFSISDTGEVEVHELATPTAPVPASSPRPAPSPRAAASPARSPRPAASPARSPRPAPGPEPRPAAPTPQPEPAELPRWLVPAAVVLVIAVAGLAAWLNAA